MAVTDWESMFAGLPSTAVSDPTERPVVQLLPGKPPDAVDKAENALITAGPGPIFQRGGQLVHVTDRPARQIDGTYDRQVAIAPVGSEAILEAFDKSACFEKMDARSRKWKKVDVPRRLAETYAGRARWDVPDLAQIIAAPTLRSNSSLLNRGIRPRYGVIPQRGLEPPRDRRTAEQGPGARGERRADRPSPKLPFRRRD